MKAERRHELKNNSLASGIEHFPDYWKEYGSKLLLVVLIAAVTFLVVKFWRERADTQAKGVSTSLEAARNDLTLLKQLQSQIGGQMPASMIAEQRQRLSQEADQSLGTVLNSSRSVNDLTSAYLSRGDLNWVMANFPELPGADTQPALQVINRGALLDQARASYEKVLEPASAPSPFDVYYARIGLAAIAENQHEWDKAKSQYDAIVSAGDIPESFKQDARAALSQLGNIQSPVVIVPAPVAAAVLPPLELTPASTSTTMAVPAVTTLATTPSSAPSVRVEPEATTAPFAAPAVAPSSAPASTALYSPPATKP